MAKMFEVKVEVVSTDYYEVEARDEDDARQKYSDGVLTGTDPHGAVVISVSELFEDDDWDGGYASGD